MSEPKPSEGYRPIEAAVAGVDDETTHEQAAEALASLQLRILWLEAENKQLAAERDGYRERYETFRDLVKRHTDGLMAAIIKAEVHN